MAENDLSKLSNIELLNHPQGQKWFEQLLKRGFLPLKINFYKEIHMQVHAEIKMGKKKRQAVIAVATRMNIEPRTIYYALKNMQLVK